MAVSDYLLGIQHIGIPATDVQKTIDFYCGLGFEIDLETVNEVTNAKVAFLKLNNLLIETYETKTKNDLPGAIDHFAIDVTDIEKVYEEIKSGGYEILMDQIHFLNYWERGVRFFTIKGPNAETIGFFQKL